MFKITKIKNGYLTILGSFSFKEIDILPSKIISAISSKINSI